MVTARLAGRVRAHRSGLFDLFVAGLVALLAALAVGAPPTDRAWQLRLVGLGMALVLLLRRRFPLPVMAAVSALALTQVLLFPPGSDPLLFDIAVLIAMYSVVRYARPLWHGLLAAVPVAIGIVIEMVRHAKNLTGFTTGTLFLVAICGGVWLTGYTVRTRRLYMASLEERALTAERERDQLARLTVADERAAIARELHDVVAHSLSVMIVQADGASYAVARDPGQATAAIRQVAATGRDALDDMRRLVSVLRGTGSFADPTEDAPPAGDPVDGIGPDRRRAGLAELPILLDRARSAGLAVEADVDPDLARLPAGIELTVYRIVQEGLTNVLRHAGPDARVRLRIGRSGPRLAVELTDDGRGRVATPPGRRTGHGLVGMRERVAVHGGAFTAGPLLGSGWRISVELPVQGRAAPPDEDRAAASGEDPAAPPDEDRAAASGEDPAAPSGEDPAAPSGEDPAAPPDEDPAAPPDEDRAALPPDEAEVVAPLGADQVAPAGEAAR
jgi:signal transduction histidine kinase